jgi:hypothetical protein
MKKYILGLVMMTVLVACSSQETETTKCDSTCADSLKCDSTIVIVNKKPLNRGVFLF